MPVSTSCKIICRAYSVFFGVVLILACLACPSSALAQTELAGVYGRVTDPSGAVIVDAEVEIKNVETNVSVTVKTNQDGLYTIPSLHPGHYLINVRKPGFKSVTVTELTLNVQDNVVRNFALQVGSIAETVTITGDDLHINTTDASVSTVVDRQFAENLPLNGRSFQTLIQLTPGVVLTGSNGTDAGQFSVNGQRATSNYWTVDGVSANIGVSAFGANTGLGGTLGSFGVLGGTNSLVSVDALQEFRIQTSTFAPEFGRTPGAQISIATRSGNNQFHGTLFEYFRNDVLDANDWFADSAGLAKPKERQNDFGGTLSGPILKNRTFFFFSYEGLRLRLPQVALTNVPCDSSCKVFGNARTSAVPAMQPFLNAYPLPNGPEVFTPCSPNVNGCPASGEQSTGAAQFNKSFSNAGTLDAYSLRIDHKLNNKFSLFGRYNYSPSELDQRGFSVNALSIVEPARITTQTGTAGLTWSISPAIVNDFRFNYSSTDAVSYTTSDDFGGATPLSSLPFPSGFSPSNAQFLVEIFSLGSTIGPVVSVGKNAHNYQRQINVLDSVSLQKGSHNMKFGFDFRRLTPQYDAGGYDQIGLFLGVPDAEAGNPIETILFSRLVGTLLFRNLGVFGQDTWRISPRLTSTYGLRWDVDFVPSSISGPSFSAVTGFNLSNLSNLALAPAGTAPYKTTYGNVAPRIGVAYQLSQTQDWQMVVRGGFGVFYDLATAESGNALPLNFYPFGARHLVFGGGFPLTGSAGAPPAITPPSPGSGFLLSAFDPNLKLPYTLQWNVAIEQALGKQQTISASYIGASGARLVQTALIFSPNPNFAQAALRTNAGTSNYQGLQLQFQRRLSHGLQALASYTWSHSIDTASASSLGSSSNALNALSPNVNRGPSDFDIRNAFSMGFTYNVPSPRSNAIVNAILRGWSTENIFQARSAPPVDVFYGSVFPFIGGFNAAVRPDAVPGQSFYLFGPNFPGGEAFNPNAFTSGTPGFFVNGRPTRQGNLSRNALRGFGYDQWDFAVHRDFPIHEAVKLQFRAEMFNVLNHPNFGQPIGNLGSASRLNPQFGRSAQMLGQYLSGGSVGNGAFDPLYQIGGPRSIQFALKLFF